MQGLRLIVDILGKMWGESIDMEMGCSVMMKKNAG
jgi:hypothetical protein